MVLILTLLLAGYVVVPRLFAIGRLLQAATSARTYLLRPSGTERPNIVQATDGLSTVIDAIPTGGGMTIHRIAGDEQVHLAVTIYGVRQPDEIARRLGVAIGGTAQLVGPDDEAAARLIRDGLLIHGYRRDFAPRDPTTAREQPELADVANWAVDLLSNGDPATISVGIERMRGKFGWEHREVRDWLDIRGADRMKEGVGPGRPLRMHAVAGSADIDQAEQLVTGILARLSRLPFSAAPRRLSSRRGIAAAAVALLIPGGGPYLIQTLHRVLDDRVVPTVAPLEQALLAGVAVMVVAFAAVQAVAPGVDPAQVGSRWLLRRGIVPIHRPFALSPGRVLKVLSGRADPRDADTKQEGKQRSLAYPHRRSTFPGNSRHLAQLLAFPALQESAAERTETARLDAPVDVVRFSRDNGIAAGSLLGRDPKGRPVRLPDKERSKGVFITGDPGSGKSYAALGVWGEDARARRSRARRNGQQTMLWWETKGDGADEAEEVLRLSGYRAGGYVRIDVPEPDGYRLELLDRTDPEGTAARLVGALTYAFETGSVGPRAAEAMRAAFALSMRLTPDITDAAGLGRAPQNIMWLAVTLMGSDSGGLRDRILDVVEVAAAAELRAMGRSVEAADADFDAAFAATDMAGDGEPFDPSGTASSGSPLYDAWKAWSYYANMNRRQYAELIESPRNKLTSLAQVTSLWTPDPDRADVSLRQLIDLHAVAIINFAGRPGGNYLDEMAASRLGATALYLLWEETKRTCRGWQALGRSLGVYADELSNVSGTGSGNDIIREMFDKGRAAGVQLTLATQRFGQLPERTQAAALGMGTRLYMTTEGIDAAEAAARDLNGGDDGALATRDIRELETGVGALRMRLGGSATNPFTVNVSDPFDARLFSDVPAGAITAGS
jgi:hypothetical protein